MAETKKKRPPLPGQPIKPYWATGECGECGFVGNMYFKDTADTKSVFRVAICPECNCETRESEMPEIPGES